MTTVDSTSDERTVNNVMRHQYRVLTDAEKQQKFKFCCFRKRTASSASLTQEPKT